MKNTRSTMATIKIKQIRSRIGSPKDQKRTLDALGLRKINQIVEHENSSSILGMVNKVKHLVSIIEEMETDKELEKYENKTISQILEEIKALPRIPENYEIGKDMIRSLRFLAGMEFSLYPHDREITRSTKPFPDLSSLNHLSYKPQERNDKYQRASTPHKTIFYGCIVAPGQDESLTRIISACEVSPLLRDSEKRKATESVGRHKLIYSKWTVEKPIKLAAVVYHPSYYGKGNTVFDDMYNFFKASIANDKRLNESQKKDYLNVNAFFANEFANPNSDYFWSALFTEILCEHGFEGVVYPPVRTEGMLGMNVAIIPNAVDEKLRFRTGAECTIYKNKLRTYIPVDRHVGINKNQDLEYTDAYQSTIEQCLEQVDCKSLDELPQV